MRTEARERLIHRSEQLTAAVVLFLLLYLAGVTPFALNQIEAAVGSLTGAEDEAKSGPERRDRLLKTVEFPIFFDEPTRSELGADFDVLFDPASGEYVLHVTYPYKKLIQHEFLSSDHPEQGLWGEDDDFIWLSLDQSYPRGSGFMVNVELWEVTWAEE